MGWARGDDAFDPVCTVIVKAVSKKAMSEELATTILTELIKGLQNRGWDTEGESLGEFRSYPYVVDAFKKQGVEFDEGDEHDVDEELEDEQ